jgi:hypothetical protein
LTHSYKFVMFHHHPCHDAAHHLPAGGQGRWWSLGSGIFAWATAAPSSNGTACGGVPRSGCELVAPRLRTPATPGRSWRHGGPGEVLAIMVSSLILLSSPKHKSCGTSDLEPMRSTNERGPQNIQHACATGPLDTTVSLPGPLYSHLACMHYSTRLEFQINYPVSSMSTHKVIYFSLVFLRNQQGNYCFSMS